ncbi:hypothetical protein [Microbulbifer aggregans]|uniref:hypothetical protein n=1 Tax=Microbulbifer aggregans TaxID=1769779 RepID=UPI001CFF3156|nr:hypothetical protein [Microbulbifer aggregans]
MNKGTCGICNRQIQNTGFESCMYCGNELLGEQKFSAAEKLALKEQKEALKAEFQRKRDSQSAPSCSNYGIDGGLDLGYSDPDCE